MCENMKATDNRRTEINRWQLIGNPPRVAMVTKQVELDSELDVRLTLLTHMRP